MENNVSFIVAITADFKTVFACPVTGPSNVGAVVVVKNSGVVTETEGGAGKYGRAVGANKGSSFNTVNRIGVQTRTSTLVNRERELTLRSTTSVKVGDRDTRTSFCVEAVKDSSCLGTTSTLLGTGNNQTL